MKTRSGRFRIATMAVSGLAFMAMCPATTAHAVVSKVESSCAASLGKGVSKLAKTLTKELAKCRIDDISGKAPGACPNAANTEKIDSMATALTAAAQSSCKSVCSVSSSVECIADALCPPRVTVTSGAPEQCTAAGTAYFDMHNIGFPGAHCEAALGHELTKPVDIGDCAADVAQAAGNNLINAIFGSLTNASSISSEAQGCVSAISKGALKLSTTVVKGVSKCHNTLLGGASGNSEACQTSDPKLVAKIDKLEAKLDGLIDSKCSPAAILELDLCGNGVGQTLTIADAKACVKAAAIEVSDSTVPPVLREYGSASIIDAAYPAAARCGDNVINQLPNSQALMGEECDGSDDAACPGACLPPGDSFECTCGDKARMRLFASHELTDADAGWTGISHQQGVSDQSGYITQLQNCNCTSFDGPTCIGSSSDPVCDLTGFQAPSCSWEPFSATRCDQRGNSNGTDENKDCAICDEWSANAGAFCADERNCNAQCYNSAGAVTGPCENQSDCGAGQICRGQCDKRQKCLIIPNGAPLPVSAAGADVCAVQLFRTDVTGTRNVITGEHEVNYRLYSVIHLGERTTRPCPVCGGFCVGGSNDREICEGRCSTTSATSCRFDIDCPSGESCSRTSPDCPGSGAFCQLDLVCGAEVTTPSNGLPCHIEYEHPIFGTMSNDCLPSASANITGQGFQIDYLTSPTSTPATTGSVSFPSTYPCTQSGLELYECPCPSQKAPNACAPACNAVGPNFGVGCATGNTTGAGTLCAGGANAGKICDEDTDCPGSSCSVNPKHCVGDPSFAQFACSTNAECGTGTCQDACPGGRCVPLCVPTLADADEGICAAGPPITHCESPRFGFQTCPLAAALSTSCAATCSVSATSCASKAECPSGEDCVGPCDSHDGCEAGADGILGTGDDKVGAGACVAFDHGCYLEPIPGEGGTTLNGLGDPEHENTVGIFCYTATTNAGVNATSGFPGPGRVRQKGTNITNGFTSIP